MSTKLSADQVIKKVYDEVTDSLKTIPSSSTSFSVELSAADGDSVLSHRNNIAEKVSVTSASPTTIITDIDVTGINLLNIHAKTTANITSAQVLTVSYSPHATDDIWITTALTITPNTTAGNVVSGTQLTALNAIRCKITCPVAISAGSFDLYIVGN